MIDIKNTIKSLALAAFFLQAFNANAFAAVHFHSFKNGGFVSQMASAVTETVKVMPQKDDKANFFNTTDLACSKVGAVKTFSITIVKNTKNGYYNIRGIIDGKADDSVGKFLRRPVKGILTSSFGYRIHPKRKKKHFHSGVDLAARSGTPITCALTGRVVFAGRKSGYGNVVVVDHGRGYTTLYAHCSRLAVKTGQMVPTGKIIAYVGMTGVATGPHLHFEVRKNRAFQNPLLYFKN